MQKPEDLQRLRLKRVREELSLVVSALRGHRRLTAVSDGSKIKLVRRLHRLQKEERILLRTLGLYQPNVTYLAPAEGPFSVARPWKKTPNPQPTKRNPH